MNRKKSCSSCCDVRLKDKIIYNFNLFKMRLTTTADNTCFLNAYNDVVRYKRIFEERTLRKLSTARVLEIGFGARPFRAFAMQPCCHEIVAVDLDQPAFNLNQCLIVWKKNGLERAIKTFIRLSFFDSRLWKGFHKEAAVRFANYDPSKIRFVTMDASTLEFWRENPGPYDLIYSDDVFEHIPENDLKNLLDFMRSNLSSEGLCIVRPFVFTGVSGGHNVEAYPHKLGQLSSDCAWQHLRNPAFKVDTYLNRLPRRRYTELFQQHFKVLSDQALMGTLGAHLLTNEIKSELANYNEYELFSNKVEYILAPCHRN